MDTRSGSTPAFAAGLAAALLAVGCAADLTETADTVTIHGGLGGLLPQKWEEYQAIQATGKRLVIDGEVISADAFLAFGAPGACYTDRAVFRPHAASYLGIIPAPDATDWLASQLPEPLEAWFRGHHSYHDWLGVARVEADELREIWPEGECEEDV